MLSIEAHIVSMQWKRNQSSHARAARTPRRLCWCISLYVVAITWNAARVHRNGISQHITFTISYSHTTPPRRLRRAEYIELEPRGFARPRRCVYYSRHIVVLFYYIVLFGNIYTIVYSDIPSKVEGIWRHKWLDWKCTRLMVMRCPVIQKARVDALCVR